MKVTKEEQEGASWHSGKKIQELQKRLQSYEGKAGMPLPQALLDAERAGRAIIERAREQEAERVTREANEQKVEGTRSKRGTRCFCRDLSNRCETYFERKLREGKNCSQSPRFLPGVGILQMIFLQRIVNFL